jgi:lysophospholipase L1-like esterase
MKSIFLFLFILGFAPAYAQAPFADEIAAFKKQDSLHPVSANSILFIGSSSFRMWTDVQQAFPKYPIINRGFGGSTLADVIYYANDIIFPYHPKQIIIYCGENDLASDDSINSMIVFKRFQTLFNMIREKLPNTSFVFVSIKPSPSRTRLLDEMQNANALIKAFLAGQSNTGYVDVFNRMIKKGKITEELFREDKLHMTEKGYAIWRKAIKPYLLKD